jgi:hypothetical protein
LWCPARASSAPVCLVSAPTTRTSSPTAPPPRSPTPTTTQLLSCQASSLLVVGRLSNPSFAIGRRPAPLCVVSPGLLSLSRAVKVGTAPRSCPTRPHSSAQSTALALCWGPLLVVRLCSCTGYVVCAPHVVCVVELHSILRTLMGLLCWSTSPRPIPASHFHYPLPRSLPPLPNPHLYPRRDFCSEQLRPRKQHHSRQCVGNTHYCLLPHVPWDQLFRCGGPRHHSVHHRRSHGCCSVMAGEYCTARLLV